MDNDFRKRSNNLKTLHDTTQNKVQKFKELTKLVNTLKEELHFSYRTIEHYKQLQDVFNKSESITVSYNKLKVRILELNNENVQLKQDLLASNTNFLQEKEEILDEYDRKINELETNFALQKNERVTEFNKKINNYETELSELKERIKKKENHMYDEIQLCQATADLQVDEAETKWKTLLNNANQKLTDLNNTCNTLRSQSMTVNNRIASYQSDIERHAQEKKQLEEKLLIAENQLVLAQEKLLQHQQSIVKKYTAPKQRYNVTKSLGCKANSGSSTTGHQGNSDSTPTTEEYENLDAVQGLYKTKQNVRLTPLKPNCFGGKKRKLYNPTSNEYLNQMEHQD